MDDIEPKTIMMLSGCSCNSLPLHLISNILIVGLTWDKGHQRPIERDIKKSFWKNRLAVFFLKFLGLSFFHPEDTEQT